MCLILTIVCPSVVYASGGNPAQENTTVIVDDSGKEMKFETVASDAEHYTINYFYDGNLVKCYTINSSSGSIMVQSENGNCYNIMAESEEPEIVSAPILRRSYGRNLGVFYYNNTNNLINPHINIMSDISNSRKSVHYVTTQAQAEFADCVAQISSTLINHALSTVSISGGVATMIAAKILTEMISAQGGKIINGLITMAISDSYDAVLTTYKITATLSANALAQSYSSYYTGTAEYVSYDGQTYSDVYYSGNTPYNWNDTRFATQTWNDTAYRYLKYTYPGLARTIVNDPAN